MKSCHRTLVFFCFLLSILPAGAREVQWQFKPPLGLVDSSPAVVDMDGDGIADLIMTTTAGSTLVVDHEGRQVWMRGVQIPISTSPTVVDLMEDEVPEVLVVNQTGTIFCMAGRTGDPIWKFSLPGKIEWGMTALAVHDLDGDGDLEIIATDNQSNVVCLSHEGEKVWTYKGNHGHALCPAVGVVGAGKEPVILIAGPKVPLLCLDASGKELWRVADSGQGASPVIADIDDDGENEIVGSLDNAVIGVDGSGKLLWKHPMPKVIDSSIAVADADENGVADIYAIDLAGTFVVLGPDGKKQWGANVRERVRRTPAVADIDGDDKLEVVVSGYSGEMYIFSGDGELKETVAVPNTTNAAPTVVDLKGDGTPSVLYVTGTGDILAYRWPDAQAEAKVQWAEYRFNSQRGGTYVPATAQSPVRITAIDYGNFYAGANTARVSIENPDAEPLRIDLTVRHSDKKPKTLVAERTDTLFEVELPYGIAMAGPSSVGVSCRVFSGDTLVAQRNGEAYVVPFRKELADLRALLAIVKGQAQALPAAYALLGELAAAEGRLPNYAAQTDVAGTLSEVARRELRDALRGELTRFTQLDTLTKTAVTHRKEGDWPLQLAASNPWAPFGGLNEVLEGRMGESRVEVSAFAGETESAAVGIVNWAPHSLATRVELDDFVLSGEEEKSAQRGLAVVTLHEVIDVPTQTLDKSADALPTMNQGQVLTLPGWEGRQLWLTINTKSLTPGIWKSKIRLRSLEVESVSYDIPLRVEVWETAQADTNVLKHCNWGYVSRSRLKHHEHESIADRVAHGNNVFVSTFLPKATYDEAGNLVGAIDYTAHDEFAAKYMPNGMILYHNNHPITTKAPKDSGAYKKAYIHYVRDWVAHLNDLGYGYDKYAMYPIDEPGLNDGLVEAYLHNAKLTRAADPKVLMYTDPVARITEEELHEMTPYVDIWCPNRVGFMLDVGAEKMEIMQKTGATMWNYECLGNAKHQSPLGYYRGQAWLAWHYNLTGIGFWSYCTSGADPWYRPQDTLDYLLTYQGDGVVTSKRWEAVRDGVEDFAMLYALREAVKSARKEGRAPAAIAQAEKILATEASAIGAFCGVDAYGTVPGKGGIPAVRVLADTRFERLQRTRAQIADVIGVLLPSN
jgi:outer membrane protein assembly factor BamB